MPDEARSTTGETNHVVVVYENSATRAEALRFCEHLDKDHRADSSFDIQWFSFASLTDDESASGAAATAANADLIVFSFTCEGDFPTEVKFWIERWLGKRTRREGALAGLATDRPRNAVEVACLREIYLRHTAHRAGMDYLSQDNPTIGRVIPDSIDSFNERAGQMTSVLDQILHKHPQSPPI